VAEGVVIAGGYRTTARKDPLAAAPLAARREAPVVVVDTHVLPPATEGCLRELGSRGLDAAGGLVVGGHAAVAGHIARGCAGLLG
jgi:poly-gamma-glutamate capsule biosynthesis protein CapA/YwtB (metallophosphatase superfamily)